MKERKFEAIQTVKKFISNKRFYKFESENPNSQERKKKLKKFKYILINNLIVQHKSYYHK